MKPELKLTVIATLLSTYAFGLSMAFAATTINATNKFSYAANLGWMDCRGDATHGAVIGEYVCSGNIYAANVGWIDLGNGSPTDQIQYRNNSATDFGVNQDGLGNLTGYAYGANIGWINFEQTYGKPRVNLFTGELSGSIYSANCGWISLSNAVAVVQTDAIQKGALAPDGLPIAWLLQNFGSTNVNGSSDPDGDGISNADEYLAGTDPNEVASTLRFTSIMRTPSTDNTALTWNSVGTRYYAVQTNNLLAGSAWGDFSAPATLGWSSVTLTDRTLTNQYYRIRAYRPLIP